jgi:hypothetical protein
MTPRTPQCKVFWALLSSSKHSGVPEDSKSPTLRVLGFTPTLGQSGVATKRNWLLTMVTQFLEDCQTIKKKRIGLLFLIFLQKYHYVKMV